MWLHLDIIERVNSDLKKVFSNVGYAIASVPTYPSGSMGFFLASNDDSINWNKPVRKCDGEGMRYYDAEVHEAAFCLPRFVKKVLEIVE